LIVSRQAHFEHHWNRSRHAKFGLHLKDPIFICHFSKLDNKYF
jgi:hypothetical protein